MGTQTLARKPWGYWRKDKIRETLSSRNRDGLNSSVSSLAEERGNSSILQAIFREYRDKELGGKGASERALLDAGLEPRKEMRRYNPSNRKWSRAAFLQDMKAVAGKDMIITSSEFYGFSSAWRRTFFVYFDSIREACKEAGITYTLSPRPGSRTSWDKALAVKKLQEAYGAYRLLLSEEPAHSGSLPPFEQWLKAKHIKTYSAVQYYFREDAKKSGKSRFHLACDEAGLNYYSVVEQVRSPK